MASNAVSSSPCVIGPQTTIRGSLSGEEDLIVEGRVEGTVSLAGHLTVAAAGILEADLDVDSAEIHGEVRGDVVAARSITVERGARVLGNLKAPRVIVRDGAQLQGAVEMDVDLPQDLPKNRR